MDELVLLSSQSPTVVEMSSVNESTNRSVTKENAEVSLSPKNDERKSLKKKTVNARQKMTESLTEQETDDAGQTSVGETTNDSWKNKNQNSKNRKRKVATEEQSENSTNQEEIKNDSGKNLKVKAARKEKRSEKVSGQKMEAGSKIVDKNIRNNKENKRGSEKSSTGKGAVHPPISEMVQDSFSGLRKRNGTSAEEICKYVDENFQVSINRIRPHIKKFLHEGVEGGLFDLMVDSKGEGKFKIKKAEKVNSKNGKTKMVKDEKRAGKVKKIAPRARKETEKVKKIAPKVRKETGKVKKIASKVRKETGKVKKIAPKVRKETEKITRKTKNDKKVKSKKRVTA